MDCYCGKIWKYIKKLDEIMMNYSNRHHVGPQWIATFGRIEDPEERAPMDSIFNCWRRGNQRSIPWPLVLEEKDTVILISWATSRNYLFIYLLASRDSPLVVRFFFRRTTQLKYQKKKGRMFPIQTRQTCIISSF